MTHQSSSQYHPLTELIVPSDEILFCKCDFQQKDSTIILKINFKQEINSGAFGSILTGQILNSQGHWRSIAVKQYRQTKHQWDSHQYTVDYLSQLENHILLSENNQVVQLFASFQRNKSASTQLYMVLQYVQLSSLEKHLSLVKKNLKLILQVFQQLISYLHYSHCFTAVLNARNFYSKILFSKWRIQLQKGKKMCAIHKDIKPQNILIRAINENKIEIAISDFGLGELCISEDQIHNNGYNGTIYYTSPEIIQRKEFDARVDCWSVGILIYELFLGKNVFKRNQQKMAHLKYMELLSCQVSKKLMEEYDFEEREKVIYILEKCLKTNYKKRIFGTQIKEIWEDYEGYLKSMKEKKQRQMNGKKEIIISSAAIASIIQEFHTQISIIKKKMLNIICQKCIILYRVLLEKNMSYFRQDEFQFYDSLFKFEEPPLIKKYQQNQPINILRLTVQKYCSAILKDNTFSTNIQEKVQELIICITTVEQNNQK